MSSSSGSSRGKVLVAISGGVDSAVTCRLLMDQGYAVEAVFMSSGYSGGAENVDPATEAEPADQRCARESSAARLVADYLGIPLHVLDCKADFDRLIDYFVAEYGRGRTPNPCLVCNRDLKFGRLLDFAASIGAQYLATGHYARRGQVDGQPAILRASNPAKDQSYALFAVPRERIGRILLPLGDFQKSDTRRLARQWHLPSADRDESQEICFVADSYLDLVRLRRPDLLRPGKILDETGRQVGEHQGVIGFTIGQRRGMRVAAGKPRYVTRIDAETATVHMGPDEALWSHRLLAESVNWQIDPEPKLIRAAVKIRYRHEPSPAEVRVVAPGSVEVTFDEPQRAITPGQAAVIYDGQRLLGGGWIDRAL